MYYESMRSIHNKVDALKTQSAGALMAEFIIECMPALKKGFSIHIDNGTVAYVSRPGFYPRYFISVDLDNEIVTFRRYTKQSTRKIGVKTPCHVQPVSGP